MSCDCTKMRRVEGGILLGGTGTATFTPGCPCSGLERIVLGEELELSGLSASVLNPFFSVYEGGRRFCPTSQGFAIRPFVLDLSCANYDLSDLTWTIESLIYRIDPDACTPDLGLGLMGFYSLTSGGFTDSDCFNQLGNSSASYYHLLRISAFSAGLFVSDPLYGIKINFDEACS